MKQKITHNLNLKILSVLFSIIIWIIVVNIDDPVKSMQFNDVPVKVINEQALTDRNLVYQIKEGNEKVDITVSGRRSVIEDLSKDNVNAVIDLEDITEDNTVKMKVSTNKYSGDIDNIKPDFEIVELEVEDLERIQKDIQIETVGNPAEGYIKGDSNVNLNRVRIEGPKSIVDRVASAKVQVDVEGATSNISASAPINLYNASGEKIDTSRITMNIDTISINQEILFTKSVSIVCIPSGKPKEGYKLNGKVEIAPSMITIAGPKPIIDNVNQITIPSSAVNIDDEEANVKTAVNILNYLPAGVKVPNSNFNGNVGITVHIEKEVSKNFVIYLNKVDLENLPDEVKATAVEGAASAKDNRLEITVWGLPDELDNLSSSDFKLSVDFEKYMEDRKATTLRPGTYDVPVKIETPAGVRCDDSLKIRFTIENK